MTDIIMNILQWAIPSGSIGAAIAWIANRKVKQAEADKRVHDIYKQMYEDLGQEQIKIQKKLDESAEKNAKAIEELNKENARMRKLLNRLSCAIEAIQLCPHRASCPVSGELRHDEDDQEGTEPGTKRTKRRQCKPKSESDGKSGEDNGDVDPADSERHGPVEHPDE